MNPFSEPSCSIANMITLTTRVVSSTSPCAYRQPMQLLGFDPIWGACRGCRVSFGWFMSMEGRATDWYVLQRPESSMRGTICIPHSTLGLKDATLSGVHYTTAEELIGRPRRTGVLIGIISRSCDAKSSFTVAPVLDSFLQKLGNSDTERATVMCKNRFDIMPLLSEGGVYGPFARPHSHSLH
jgi:hypothetical protein